MTEDSKKKEVDALYKTFIPAIEKVAAEWDTDHTRRHISSATVMAEALRSLKKSVEVRLESETVDADGLIMADLIVDIGSAHALIRYFMEVVEPKKLCHNAGRLVVKTRELIDIFYDAMKLQEPPTLRDQDHLNAVMKFVKEQLVEKLAEAGPKDQETLH